MQKSACKRSSASSTRWPMLANCSVHGFCCPSSECLAPITCCVCCHPARSPIAQKHDDASWKYFCSLTSAKRLSRDGLERHVATLPARNGGLGLRSALRTSMAAYWASWVDGAEVLIQKPHVLLNSSSEKQRLKLQQWIASPSFVPLRALYRRRDARTCQPGMRQY